MEQNIKIQQQQALELGFVFDEVIQDEGISEHQNFANRPGGWRLLDKVRSGDTIVVRWFDRVGRNYNDVCKVLHDLIKRGVTIKTVIGKYTLQATDDPIQRAIQDAMINFMAATAQAESETMKIVQQQGIERARTESPEKYQEHRRRGKPYPPSWLCSLCKQPQGR